jgi:hypothetical protein
MKTIDHENKMKIARVFFLVLCVLLLSFALFMAKYDVYSLADDKHKMMSSLEFTEQNTSDGLLIKDGKLYDVYSLPRLVFQEKDGVIQGNIAPSNPNQKTRDCKT